MSNAPAHMPHESNTPRAVPSASASEMSATAHHDTAFSNNNTSQAFFVTSHLAIVSATQSNIGTKYHRQNDAKRAMEWYLESIRTRAALYALPTLSPPTSVDTSCVDVDNSNCSRDVDTSTCNKGFPPSPPLPKRRRVGIQSTSSNSRSNDDPASSQHDQLTTSDVDDANLLVKYLYEATTIEAIEASASIIGSTTRSTTDVAPFPQGSDIADDHEGESEEDADGDVSGDDGDDDASFDSSPLDEDEEEELSSFLHTSDIVGDNNLSFDTTGRHIGLNHFASPITIDLSSGMTAADHQQEHQDGGGANNNRMRACYAYEYDIDAHAAMTLFNMSLLHQQDGTNLDTCRRYLEVGLHLLTQQATLSKSPLHTCLAIVLHTNLGYISYVSGDNDSALLHFTMAFSIVCHAVERTFKDIESTETGSGALSNAYLQSKRACHYYYCRAEIAALINVARSCEAGGLYEIALRACTSAIQRLQSNPALLAGDDLPFCTVQSAIDADHQAFEEQLALSHTFGSDKNSSSLDLNSAMFVMASIHSQLANDDEALRYYAAYFHHVTIRHGSDHPHATAAILGINLIQLLTRGRMSLAAGAA